MTRFAALPPDILHHLLLNVSDFRTLSTALRTCRGIYGIFQEHPLSIVTAVAANVVGGTDVLPAAVRLVEYQREETWCDEESAMTLHPLTRKSCAMLERNAAMVKRMEHLFSETNKDQTTRRSQLTAAEAFRFRRASYRFWLYSSGVFSFTDTQDFLSDEQKSRYTTHFQHILDGFSTVELFEVDRFVSFLRDIVKQTWVACVCRNEMFIDFQLEPEDAEVIKGFDIIVDEYEKAKPQSVLSLAPDPPMVSYSDQINAVYSLRGISEERRDSGVASAIIDSINGAGNTCCYCHDVKGLDLCNILNWDRLRYRIELVELWKLTGSKLQHNVYEMQCFTRTFRSWCWPNQTPPFNWTIFLQLIFAMDSDERGPLDCTQWYCKDCVMNVLRSRLRLWWAEQKSRNLGRLEGTPPQKAKCWFGHECRTQVRRRPHAERLCHLYDPIPEKSKRKHREEQSEEGTDESERRF